MAINPTYIQTIYSHSFNKSLWERDKDWTFSETITQLLMELVSEIIFISLIWPRDMLLPWKNYLNWKTIMMFLTWVVERVTVFMKLLKDIKRPWENLSIGLILRDEVVMYRNWSLIQARQIENWNGKLNWLWKICVQIQLTLLEREWWKSNEWI